MSIFNLLSPSSVLVNLEAKDSSEVIRTMGEKLKAQGFVGDDFVEATLKREENAPTGLILAGKYNAALPHVDLEYVKSSALGLATLKKEVTFQNMVNKAEAVPVRLVIMLALSDPKQQINALGQISNLLQNPQVVDRLVESSNDRDIFSALGEIETEI